MLQAWGQRPNNHYHWKATKLDNLHGRCHDIHRSLHKYLELNIAIVGFLWKSPNLKQNYLNYLGLNRQVN